MGNTLSYYIDVQPIKIDNLRQYLLSEQSIFEINTNFQNCYYHGYKVFAYVNILKPFTLKNFNPSACNPSHIILLTIVDKFISITFVSKERFSELSIFKPNISFGDNNIKYKLIDINTETMNKFKNYNKYPLNDYQLYKLIKKNDTKFSRLENVYCTDNTFESEKISFCQICICIYQEGETILTYQPISLSGEILDEIDIKESNIILIKYYNDGNIKFEIYDENKDNEILNKYYIKKLKYIDNKIELVKEQYLDHIKTIIY